MYNEDEAKRSYGEIKSFFFEHESNQKIICGKIGMLTLYFVAT